MTKILQGPVRAQDGAGPGEHGPGRIVGQRPERPPQRPPQRLIPASGHQAGHLRLIQPQPHERIRGRGQLLQRPWPLRITVISCCPGSASAAVAPSSSDARAPVDTQNATSARSRCDPSPANSCPNFSSGICRGTRRAIFGRYLPPRSPANGCIGL